MKTKNIKVAKRKRRHAKIRTRLSGTKETPRLAVFKSNVYIYAQLVNDEDSTTIASAQSLGMKGSKKKTEAAFEVGKNIAKNSLAKGIKQVVFDRGGFRFSGRVAELARGAREGGLKF